MLKVISVKNHSLFVLKEYSKTCLKRPLKIRPNLVFKTDYGFKCRSKVLCRMLMTLIKLSFKLPFVFKTFVLSILEWPLKTGFTVCFNVSYFNNGNKCLIAKKLKQGCRYHKLCKAFSKFYLKHLELIVKYNDGLDILLQQGISEPVLYGDLVYKFKRIIASICM